MKDNLLAAYEEYAQVANALDADGEYMLAKELSPEELGVNNGH